MAFRFHKASCVAIGAFNVYIIQPKWLMAKELIPSDIPLSMETKLDEPGFKFSSDAMKSRWAVTPTRVVIETDDESEDCGELMARLLEWLPQTPLSAIGNNVYYRMGKEEGDWPELPDYPVPEALSDQIIKQRTFHVAVEIGTCVHNLQVSALESEIEVLTNAHHRVVEESADNDSTDNVKKHARRFDEHRKLGAELAFHYLKAQINVP